MCAAFLVDSSARPFLLYQVDAAALPARFWLPTTLQRNTLSMVMAPYDCGSLFTTVERATRLTSLETVMAQLAVPPLVTDTIELPAITNPVEAVVLFAERSTAVAWRAERVPMVERSGPFTTAHTVLVPAVVEMEPEVAVPRFW